jgi:hypothetical protein
MFWNMPKKTDIRRLINYATDDRHRTLTLTLTHVRTRPTF